MAIDLMSRYTTTSRPATDGATYKQFRALETPEGSNTHLFEFADLMIRASSMLTGGVGTTEDDFAEKKEPRVSPEKYHNKEAKNMTKIIACLRTENVLLKKEIQSLKKKVRVARVKTQLGL